VLLNYLRPHFLKKKARSVSKAHSSRVKNETVTDGESFNDAHDPKQPGLVIGIFSSLKEREGDATKDASSG
jgi:hypothetical protein